MGIPSCGRRGPALLASAWVIVAEYDGQAHQLNRLAVLLNESIEAHVVDETQTLEEMLGEGY